MVKMERNLELRLIDAGYNPIAGESGVNINLQDPKAAELIADIELMLRNGTPIPYLPVIGFDQRLRLFWEQVAKELSLELKEIPGRRYFDTCNPAEMWYETIDKKSGAKLVFGNIGFPLYFIGITFPISKTPQEMIDIAKDFKTIAVYGEGGAEPFRTYELGRLCEVGFAQFPTSHGFYFRKIHETIPFLKKLLNNP